MLKTAVVIAAMAVLGGCAVAPGYGYGYSQPYADDSYGYAPGYYAPLYGSVSVWGGGGYYRERGFDHWHGGGRWNGGRGGGRGSGHGGGGHGGGGGGHGR